LERDDWELLDLDRGRKLERFGEVVVARPAPAVRRRSGVPREAWSEVAAEFVREGRAGRWVRHRALPDPWLCRSAGRVHELMATPSGQVGLFPEHAPLREALERSLRERTADGSRPRVLDLFSYTGGSAMAAAAAGAEVVSVDSAKSVLGWARRNAERNGLGDAPVRRIPEDAARFVEREGRRGRRYDAVLLDPPSFGRGPGGRTWKIERDLAGLLAGVAELLSERSVLVLLTAHTTAWTPETLAGMLEAALGERPGRTGSGRLTLAARSGATLHSGVWARREFDG
jgi:23S rRNA (cytosine1962-C5)-methyltransferase